jgi:uncharacterized protein (TIGR03437 family)
VCNRLRLTRLLLAFPILVCGIAQGAAPSYSAAGILSVGSYAPGPFAPNSLISIYGIDLAIGERTTAASDIVNNTLPTELNSTRVYIDFVAAPLFYVSKTQINLLIPGKQALGKAQIQVVREGQPGPVVTIDVAAAAPELFVNGGYALAVHGENITSLITADQPARPGELIVIYAAGLGKCETMPGNGELTGYLSELVNRSTAFRISVNGTTVDARQIFYAGLTPGSAGLYQTNFVLPDNAGADPEVRLFVGDAGSPVGVKLALRPTPQQPSDAAGR